MVAPLIVAIRIGMLVYKVARSPAAQLLAKQAIRKGASIVKNISKTNKSKVKNLTTSVVKNIGKTKKAVKDVAPKGKGQGQKVKDIVKQRKAKASNLDKPPSQLTQKQREVISNINQGKNVSSQQVNNLLSRFKIDPKAVVSKGKGPKVKVKKGKSSTLLKSPKLKQNVGRSVNRSKVDPTIQAMKRIGLTAAGIGTVLAINEVGDRIRENKRPKTLTDVTGAVRKQEPVGKGRLAGRVPSDDKGTRGELPSSQLGARVTTRRGGAGDNPNKPKSPSASSRFRDADRGSMKKLSDKKLSDARKRLRDADKSTTTSTPTKADKSSGGKGPSGSSFGSFKEAFKHYNSLKNKPSTFNYKGKSYANVTKDQLTKSGHKTLRSYLNAKGKPASSSNSDAGKQNKLVGGKGWGLTKEAQSKLPKSLQKLGVGQTKKTVTLFGKKFNFEAPDPKKRRKAWHGGWVYD